MSRRRARVRIVGLAVAAAILGSGCHSAGSLQPVLAAPEVDDATLPKELNMVTLPPYTVGPPDVLLIDAQRLIPLPPYRIEPLDSLFLYAPGAPEKEPINGVYAVDPEGTINLGPNYGGTVRVAELTIAEIEKAVTERLGTAGGLREPKTVVSLAQSRGVQQVRGEHLVRPDGTVSLGLYGAVYVAGLTLPQVKMAIEQHLSRYLLRPEVSVDVSAYKSKFYYVVTDCADGEQVSRLPATGNETVLDAIALVGGLSSVPSKQVWVARPAPHGNGDQILPVDWQGITRRGNTRTNYQVLPGDRVFVMGQPVTQADRVMGRLLAPVKRGLEVTLLGTTAVQSVEGCQFEGGH